MKIIHDSALFIYEIAQRSNDILVMYLLWRFGIDIQTLNKEMRLYYNQINMFNMNAYNNGYIICRCALIS
jgi:hypothetical protein